MMFQESTLFVSVVSRVCVESLMYLQMLMMMNMGKNKTSRAGQMTTGPGHSCVDYRPICSRILLYILYSIHPLDIQYVPFSISLCGALNRGAVSTVFKVFGMTGPGWIRTQDLPQSEQTLYYYAIECGMHMGKYKCQIFQYGESNIRYFAIAPCKVIAQFLIFCSLLLF